ncbi:MAG TPA: PDZ domain-containing protein [Terracidiphilus sp.]|nr:PDZ domain-containing protein [Terracidiphilus sp.]
MKMIRNRVLMIATFCAALSLPAPLAAELQSHWYQPHYLPSVEDASDQLKLASPHFSPMSVEVYNNGSRRAYGLTSGYSLERVDVNRLDINLFFTKSGVVQNTQYFWSWWGGYVAPVTTPYKDDIVTSIVYKEIQYFEIWNFPREKNQATWCVAPTTAGLVRNSFLCVATEQDARAVADAIATLVVASGVNLDSSQGLWVDVKELQKHPDEACKLSDVDLDGPPAQAGIKAGDIVRSINGRPCTGKTFYHDINLAMLEKKGSGAVHVEILRKNNTMAFDLNYPNPDAGVVQLRQQSAGSARHPVGSVIPVPEANPVAPSPGVHFGLQVRPVIQDDLAPLSLTKAQGIVVVSVENGSLADTTGLLAGDVILAVNGAEVGDLQQFVQTIRSGVAKSFRVWRKGQMLELTVPLSI